MKQVVPMGDIALNGLFISDQKNNYKRFEKILAHFENSFIIANLETPIRAGDNLNPNKNTHLYTDEDIVAEVLPLLNVRLVSLANNHIGDYGIDGVKKTIDVLDKLNILHTGAGSEKKHIEPIIFDLENKKIAENIIKPKNKIAKNAIYCFPQELTLCSPL